MGTDSRAFNIKAYMYSSTVIELHSCDIQKISNQLTTSTQLAPKLFDNQATILDFSKLSHDCDNLSLKTLKETLKKSRFSLIGIHQAPSHIVEENAISNNPIHIFDSLTNKSQTKIPQKIETPTQAYIHTGQVRSGQQIIKKNQDVIIYGNVSPGAEILSGGHIIIYGLLGGKAFAGINGSQDTKIICFNSTPELVSIASRYQESPSREAKAFKHLEFMLQDNKVIKHAFN